MTQTALAPALDPGADGSPDLAPDAFLPVPTAAALPTGHDARRRATASRS